MFHDQRELQQIIPARAKKKLTVHELETFDTDCWDEEKIDGERYLIHSSVGGPYPHACTSRRLSEVTGRMVEKTDRVPHLMTTPLPPVSLLDCEFVSSGDIVKVDLPGHLWDKMVKDQGGKFISSLGYLPAYPHVGNTVSIMGSLGPEAVRKQEERGPIWAYCFDILQYDRKFVTHNTQRARRKFLTQLFENIDPASGLILMPRWEGLTKDERILLYTLITDIKGEGLILKDPTKMYDEASNWYKVKLDFPVDCVLTGRTKEGKAGVTGKMLGLVGSLEIGVYVNNTLIPVGWMSAIMDSEANLPCITQLAREGKLRGMVYECRHNGLQDDPTAPLGFTLRHPRHRRPREDKNATDCTLSALLNECASKAEYAKYNK